MSRLWIAMLALSFSALSAQPMTEEQPAPSGPAKQASIFGTVVNGTTGAQAAPEEISLMRPGQGMQILQTIRPGKTSFRFDPVTVGQGPLLIRAVYSGENYIHVVPPAPRFYLSAQQVTVFETGARSQDVLITSGMQVEKRKDTLHVSRVYAIENRSSPGKTFPGGGLHIYLPASAQNVVAQVQHENSMPVPGALKPDGFLARGIRPGNSELSIEYDVPGYVLEERRHELADFKSGHSFLVLVYQPTDAKPRIEGATAETVDIPKVGPALQINLGEGPVEMDFSAGGYVVENPLNSDTNSVFDEPWKMAVALVCTILIFFLGASVVAASGISIVKRSPTAEG